MDAVKKLDGPRTVFDIGAHDGKTNSNSLALIEMGWSAVLIEPSPSCFLKLLDRHAGNPKVTLINAAIGLDKMMVKFYEFVDDQCGTTVRANAEKWTSPERKCREYWISQVTIPELLNQVGGCADVLSIDTEGTAFDILGKCPITSWNPTVIVVEHDLRAYEMAAWAERMKYDIHGLNAENLVMVKR